MKRITLKLLAVVFVSLLFSAQGFSQSKELKKLMDNPKKFHKKLHVTDSNIKKFQIKKGWAKAEAYKVPERVGLLTYIVTDKASTQSSVGGGLKTTTRTWRTKEGVSEYANHLYVKTIDDIKNSFSSRGMNLLEVHEYLDTPEKVEMYENYELKKLKGMKIFAGLTGAGNTGPVQGYRIMDFPYFGLLPKAVKARDRFFEALGLDAVLVVVINMDSFNDSFYRIRAELLCKNPAHSEKTTYGKYYENIMAELKTNEYEKKPTYEGIHILGDEEYLNKRGKKKKRKVITGFDPNFYKVISSVADVAAERTKTYMEN